MMHPKLIAAFERHAVSTYDKQLHLSELVGRSSARLDLQTGVLEFSHEQFWQAEVLGFESEKSSTWQWAWASEEGAIPKNLSKSARGIKKFGEENGIPELIQPQWDL